MRHRATGDRVQGVRAATTSGPVAVARHLLCEISRTPGAEPPSVTTVAMHSGEISLSTDVAASLVADQFPQWRHEPVEHVVTDGTVHRIYRIGTRRAARFPLGGADPAVTAAQLRREAAAMEELTGACPFPTPQHLGIGRSGRGFPLPWSVQSWLPGEVATPLGLAGSVDLATDLATLVVALRAAPTRGRTFTGGGRGGHLPDSDAWMETCFRKSGDLLPVPRLRSVWARLRALPRDRPDVMSHGDLIPANLLVASGRLVGVLDTGGFAPADPALDLVSAWHLLDAERRRGFRELVGADDTEWGRGAAWAFQQALGLVWYYETTNPGMAALGRSTVARIVEELDP